MYSTILDIKYLKQTLPPTIEDNFYTYLSELTAEDVVLYALKEGSVAFPRYFVYISKIYKVVTFNISEYLLFALRVL